MGTEKCDRTIERQSVVHCLAEGSRAFRLVVTNTRVLKFTTSPNMARGQFRTVKSSDKVQQWSDANFKL